MIELMTKRKTPFTKKERYNETLGDYNAKTGAENRDTMKSCVHKDEDK